MKRRNMHLDAPPIIFKYAQQLRANETKAEKFLWWFLSSKQMEGVKFRRQHPLKKYAVDFYNDDLRLGIEVDGKYHESEAQKIKDAKREAVLERYGITLLRFTNEQVLQNIQFVLDEIRRIIRFIREFQE